MFDIIILEINILNFDKTVSLKKLKEISKSTPILILTVNKDKTIIKKSMDEHKVVKNPELDEILEIDEKVKENVRKYF